MPYQFGYEIGLPYQECSPSKYSKSDWREQVCEKAGVHPQFLTDLEHSPRWRFDFASHRRAARLLRTSTRDPSDVEIARSMDDFVGLLIDSKLPMSLYINWGPIEHLRIFVPRSLERIGFFPDHLEIQYLRNLPGRIAFSRWTRGQDRHQGARFPES
ncbi:hypothetical protein B0H14DRAFT_3455210 [Mycena olivaceomarginata]|nr:hypothetical protein B0H14DRAFT_3455210 [Mycena olivaceomarginata]